MPKNVLQDVMPPKKRSIRNIPLSQNKKRAGNGKKNLSNFSGPVEGIKGVNKNNSSKTKWWFLLIFTIIVALVGASFLFSSAEVVLTPKQEIVDLTTNLIAVKKGADSKEAGVPYRILTISNEGSQTTSNIEEKEVDKKASGQIVIFNDYNSSSQRLVKNTRFETPDGLIYRINKSVIVPGKKNKDGKIIPGSVTVTVYADSPGKEYNIGLVDFTIPGFKGTDRFSKFYARSKTSMEGGFSGVMKIVTNNELKQIRKSIQVNLEEDLKDAIYSQIPENSVLYRDGIYINFEPQENIDLGDSVQVVEKGILTAILFDKNELSNYIAKNVVNLDEGSVEISNIDELDFLIDNKDYIKPWEDSSFKFSLSGSANFVWVFDNEKIKESLAGHPKNNTSFLLSNYPGIEEAVVTISPFWKRNFPKDTNKIKVKRALK